MATVREQQEQQRLLGGLNRFGSTSGGAVGGKVRINEGRDDTAERSRQARTWDEGHKREERQNSREDLLRQRQWDREDFLRRQQWDREDRRTSRSGGGSIDARDSSGASGGGGWGSLAPFDDRATRLDYDLRMREQDAQRAFLREQAAGRKSSIDALIGRFDKETDPATVDYQGPIQAQEDAARGAAFARAKEMAAMNARASMTALEDTAADQGFTGSTMQAGEAGRIVGGARADVHDFIRGQQISDTDRAKEVANMRYQGGITQRGQTMGRQQSRQQAIVSLMQNLY